MKYKDSRETALDSRGAARKRRKDWLLPADLRDKDQHFNAGPKPAHKILVLIKLAQTSMYIRAISSELILLERVNYGRRESSG